MSHIFGNGHMALDQSTVVPIRRQLVSKYRPTILIHSTGHHLQLLTQEGFLSYPVQCFSSSACLTQGAGKASTRCRYRWVPNTIMDAASLCSGNVNTFESYRRPLLVLRGFAGTTAFLALPGVDFELLIQPVHNIKVGNCLG